MNGIRQPGPAWDVTSGDGSALLPFLRGYRDTLTTGQLNLPLQTPLQRTPRFLEELELCGTPPSRPGSTEAQGGSGRASKDRWVVLPSEGDLSRVPT